MYWFVHNSYSQHCTSATTHICVAEALTKKHMPLPFLRQVFFRSTGGNSGKKEQEASEHISFESADAKKKISIAFKYTFVSFSTNLQWLSSAYHPPFVIFISAFYSFSSTFIISHQLSISFSKAYIYLSFCFYQVFLQLLVRFSSNVHKHAFSIN